MFTEATQKGEQTLLVQTQRSKTHTHTTIVYQRPVECASMACGVAYTLDNTTCLARNPRGILTTSLHIDRGKRTQ